MSSTNSSQLKDLIAGAVAGSYGVVLGSPLDVIAVRLQQPNTPYRGIWHCCSSLVRSEGPLALYKGMSSPLVTVAVQQSVCFQAFGFANRALASHTGIGADGETGHGLSEYARLYLAGSFAGAVQCLVTVPQELLKIRMQVQQPARGQVGYVNALAMVRSIIVTEGLGGMVRGFGVTLLRDVPSYGLYFAINQAVKDALQPGASSTELHAGTELFAGGMAGMLAWASIYPMEVIKCRVQAGRGSGREVVAAILRQKGVVGFFVGMQPVMMRAFVTNAAIFYGFGVANRALESHFSL